MSQHMSQDRAGDGVEAVSRAGRATGSHILIPSGLSENVHDAAKKADFSPKAFVRNAVESALNVSDAEIDVTGLDTPGETGYVTLSAPDFQTAKMHAERTDGPETVDEWVQGVVRGRVEQVWAADEAQKRAEQTAQAAMSGAFIPAPDPAGILANLSGGAIRDPARVMMKGQQGR